MRELVMLVGPSYSGKSSVAKLLAKSHESEIFSSDGIREEIYGSADVQTNPSRVFEILHRRLKEWLRSHPNGRAIYDATNLSCKRRMSFLRDIDNMKIGVYKICVVVTATLPDIQERMKTRKRVVPYEAIYRQLCNFQYPGYYEGWDNIGRYSTSTNEDCAEWFFQVMSQANHLEHDNPHHSLNVGKHMEAAGSYCLSHFPDSNLITRFAVSYHDIGKVFTKKFENGRGKPTEIAHYIGHHNFGAYILATVVFRPDDARMVALLVQWHMSHFIESEERLQKIYGWMKEENLYTALKILEECDKAAH